MYLVGFLGTRKGDNNVFVFDDPMVLLPQQQYILVHPAFHSALGLQESNVVCEAIQGALIGDLQMSDLNVGGDVIGRDKVVQTFYSTEIGVRHELESLLRQLDFLKAEQALLEQKLMEHGTTAPIRLKHEIEDLFEKILRVKQRIRRAQEHLDA